MGIELSGVVGASASEPLLGGQCADSVCLFDCFSVCHGPAFSNAHARARRVQINQPRCPRTTQYWIAKKQQDKRLKPDFLKKEGKKVILKMDTEEVTRQAVEATLLKAIEVSK